MNEKGLMEQSNAAIKAALELYAADHGKAPKRGYKKWLTHGNLSIIL